MKNKVFISGSISIKSIPKKVEESLQKISQGNLEVLIGDADGIDILIQNFFKHKSYFNVKVYSIYSTPRNIATQEFGIESILAPQDIKKERDRQSFKDEKMSEDCDYSLVIWDGKSKGSYQNILKCIELGKPVKVFLEPLNNFIDKKDVNVNNIKFIFSENNGYSASEIVDYLHEDGILNFKNTRELNKYLVDQKIIIKNNEVYEPVCFKEHFIVETYKGKKTGIKFRNSFIDWIKSNISIQYQSQDLFSN